MKYSIIYEMKVKGCDLMYGIGFDKDMVKTKRIGTGFKELMKEPRFKKEQEIYEHKLGVYAFKSKKANSAVDLTSAGVGHDKDASYAMSLCDDAEQEVLNMSGAKWKVTDVYEDVPLKDYAGNGNISGIKDEAKKVKEKSSKEDYKNYCEQKKVSILVKMKEIG